LAKGSAAFAGGKFAFTPKADLNGADAFTIAFADGDAELRYDPALDAVLLASQTVGFAAAPLGLG